MSGQRTGFAFLLTGPIIMTSGNKFIRIALVASYPAQSVLSADLIKPGHRTRPTHPLSWVRSLAAGLRQFDDLEIRVFTYSRAVWRTCAGEENGVPFTVVPQYEPARLKCFHLYLPARLMVGMHIRRYKPHLVHGFGTETCNGVIASDFGRRGIVMIQGIHEKLAPYYDRMSRVECGIRGFLESQALRRVAGAIVETAYGARWLEQRQFMGKVAVIPHAVNPEFFKVKPQYSTPEILCIGTLSQIKGQDSAIRALAATRDPTIRLALIGYGPTRQPLEKMARDLGVAARVEFCGFLSRPALMERMKTARALAMLSRMDSSPNVITEAHAAGLPVIGTRAGGIPDMIEEGHDGFLVDVDDFRDAAEKMDLLVAHPSLCREMGEKGREKVRTLNDPGRVAILHREFYAAVLHNSLTSQ